MSRGLRALVGVGLALACAGCACFLGCGALVAYLLLHRAPGPGGGGRTVVLIAVDDLARDHLRPCGYRFDPAPGLTALAASGAAAPGYRAASAGTAPSLASLLTGLAPEQHGLRSARELGAQGLSPSVETLPEALRAAGWHTAGAVSLRQLERRFAGLDQGFGAWLELGPASGLPADGAAVAAALARESDGVGPDEDLFLFLQLGDLRAEGPAPGVWLERHLAPFRAAQPAIDAALKRAGRDPKGALQDLEHLLARRRGDPALAALQAARYDARLEELDRALGALLDRLREARGEPLVIVAGTRGRDPGDGGAAGAEALRDTALIAAGPGVGGAWSALAGPEDLGRVLRATLGLPPAAPLAAGGSAGGPGWELVFDLPPGVEGRARIESPTGELAAVGGAARDVRRSPAGGSAELSVSGGGAITVECARRTAPLVLLAPGLGAARPARAGACGAFQLPVFPASAPGAEEGPPPRVLVERDGAWAVARAAGAAPGELVELALWACPPEPFGASLELEVEPAGAEARAFPGLDAVLVRARGPTLVRVQLRAGQRLALAASIGGEPVAPAQMRANAGGSPDDLALYLPPSDAASLPLAPGTSAGVRAQRLYAGPPMDAPYDLDDDDVRFLRRLGPLE